MVIVLILLVVTWFGSFIQFSACLTWTKYPDSISSVWNGSKVELQWDYNLTTAEQNSAKNSYSLFWKRGNVNAGSKTYSIFSPAEVITEPFKPHITINRSEKATLIINDVTKEDEGVYKFIVVINGASSRNTTLHVKVQPTIQCPKIVKVIQGEQAIISCNVTGDPTPNITWTKESQFGNVICHNSTLVMDNVRISDGGKYKITANNGRSTSDVVKLEILFAPWMTNLTIGSNPNNITVLLNRGLTLLCVTNANPPALYYLYSNESYIGKSSSGEFNITVEGDGVYTCVPINPVGKGNNDTLSVIAVVPPSVEISNKTATAVKGDKLNFTCVASGKPEPKIAWNKVGNATVITDTPFVSVIVDRPVTPDDMNQYQCTARNGVGTPATATINVTVNYKPSATRSSSTIELELGEDRSIGCPVDVGNPPAVVTWHKRNCASCNKTINSSTLEVQNASLNDKGWYTCFAKNELGNTTVNLLLLVVKPASSTVATSFQTTPTVSEGTQVILTATIQENCNRRSEVAAKFPEMACQIALRFGCSSANTVNTRCGSVVLDFMMRFNQSVVVSNVLTLLSDAARQGQFGSFEVNPDSIQLVLIPTDGSESTTRGPEECNCSSNNVLLAIIAVLAFTILLLISYIIWLHKKAAIGKQRSYGDERGVYDNETGLENIEPSLPDSRKLTQPPAEYMDLIEVNKDDRKAQRTAPGADYMPLRTLTGCWEVPRHHVTIEKVIGKGAFGQVAKGTAVGLPGSPETTTVAIKMLKRNATESDKRDLMKELDTMKQLKPHPHVIKLLGCVTESEKLLVLIEYVPFGDLLGYLRKSRGLKDTYYKDPDIKPQTNLTSQQLMKFAWQIADGMSYLSAKSIIHRDLAARNVLVGQKETCKVTDFGMARDVQQENIYERNTKGRLPVKWTAYEALLYGKYTTKSDVWSYGVLLYEVFTIGGSPYPRMDGRKIANLLQNGYRMPKPQHVDEKLYQIMMKCWRNDPDARPTFTELKNQLKDMETLHRKLINMTMYDKQLYANVEDLTV